MPGPTENEYSNKEQQLKSMPTSKYFFFFKQHIEQQSLIFKICE